MLEALQDRVLPALETLVAAARKRDELETQVIETKALRRSNVVKTAVLRSVSHDLRSPLTAITTAAGGLGSDTLSAEARAELTSVIALEAPVCHGWWTTCSTSRSSRRARRPHADWCSVEELVRCSHRKRAHTAGRLRRADRSGASTAARRRRTTRRAIANVLDNATRYSGDEPVTVRARAAPNQLLLRVGDRGPGIAREELDRIFEPFHSPGEAPGPASDSQSRAASWRRTGAHPRRVPARPGHDDRADPAGAGRAAGRGARPGR